MAEVLDPPKSAKKDSITITMDALAKMIDEKVQEQLSKLSDGKEMVKLHSSSMPMYPYEPRDGDVVPPGFAPPPGWQLIKTTDGNLIIHPKAPSDFNRREHRDVLRLVDEKWQEMNHVVAGQPVPDAPKKLMVNERFQQLFSNLVRWGDECQVMLATDEAMGKDAIVCKTSKARFKFVR